MNGVYSRDMRQCARCGLLRESSALIKTPERATCIDVAKCTKWKLEREKHLKADNVVQRRKS